MKKKKIFRKGPVTKENAIFSKHGSVLCPFSTNSLTEEEYFLIDADMFKHVEGRSWYVMNTRSHVGETHLTIVSNSPKRGSRLHWVLYQEETLDVGLSTDHLYHWTDNRRDSVEFVPLSENQSRGAAAYHSGRKNRK